MNILSVENRTRTSYQPCQSALAYNEAFECQLPPAIRAELEEPLPRIARQPVPSAPLPVGAKSTALNLLGLSILLGGIVLVLLLAGLVAGTIGSRGEKHSQAQIDALLSTYQPVTELQVGHWYHVTLPNGQTIVACYQGERAELPPQGRFLGEEWKVDSGADSHCWIWMVPVGAHLASWVDP